MKTRLGSVLLGLLVVASFRAAGQGTAFTYQGRLSDSGSPANGNYDLQFYLRDALVAGNPVGATNTLSAVAVSSGLFTVTLDFGTTVFEGSARWLEIDVRTNGSASAYTILAPRQQITSAPYALRSLSATSADAAANATQLGGVAANQYVQTNDPHLSDSRPPTAGSSNYIQNTTSQQADSSFSITGNGTAGGTLYGASGVLGASSGASVRGIIAAGVYGTSSSSSGYGVYGLVSAGTQNAGVYGKSTASNGAGVLGQADTGTSAYGVWGKSSQGQGVVGHSTSGTGVYGSTDSAGTVSGVYGTSTVSDGNGVIGEANGSNAYGVWGKSSNGTAVYGNTDTGRAVNGIAFNGGVGVYGNNLNSNTQGYAGYFFGRVAVTGAIHAPGAAFIHTVNPSNRGSSGPYTWIDNPLTNGDPHAILIVTPTASPDGVPAGSATIDFHPAGVYYRSSDGKWMIYNADSADVQDGQTFNVLVLKQ